MKNGLHRLFSFRDMKAQTSMRSKKRKMSQKLAVQKRAFPWKVYYSMKVIEFWHNGRWAQRPQNVKNSQMGNFL